MRSPRKEIKTEWGAGVLNLDESSQLCAGFYLHPGARDKQEQVAAHVPGRPRGFERRVLSGK